MSWISIDNQMAEGLSEKQREEAIALCPFGAIERIGDTLSIHAGCRMCKLCVKNGREGLFTLIEDAEANIDKSLWKGIAVYVELDGGSIHPVSLELIGKARELAEKAAFPVYALVIGEGLTKPAEELLHYGVDNVYVYDNPAFRKFVMEPYTSAFYDFIQKVKPSVILTGATMLGRSLAPRAAARARTGLTADCTKLDIKENTDLVQIRPAFGGNIMAQIITPGHRPQMATVRYKIFNAPTRQEEGAGQIVSCEIEESKLASGIRVVSEKKKERKPSISDAEVIVALGRGVKAQKDIELFNELAKALEAEIACTRPLIESGWVCGTRQIGLSGRTVKPKLIVTLGVSGSVQFKAGMENAELIIAINTDEKAQIFDVAHYAVQGDIYDIVPRVLDKIKERGGAYVQEN